MIPRSIDAGGWRITALSDGFMRLDGGAMWGVVPRSMWERLTPPAADHTIRLALRPFLAEKDGMRVVIEPGIGERWEPKWTAIYQLERAQTLAGSLAELGLSPGDVTHVVASHCHFDHCGAWVVEHEGVLAPLFPGARHLAPAVEIAVARAPDHVRRASYRPEDVTPLEAVGLLEGYSPAHRGALELLPGLWAHEAGGHSDGVVVLAFGDGGRDTALFWADVVPTSHHVQPAYIMAYDIDVPRSFASRSHWLARAAEEGWIGLFYHDEEHAFGRVHRSGKRYAFEPLEGRPAGAST
jgi:glyoxylase-like metal-dependent hydrolase (beta-lactamase superfamily II)